MMSKLPYTSFVQAQHEINNIEAIDYFFANEMIKALVCSTKYKENVFNIKEQTILLHLFFTLSESLRLGHTCLPLTQVANDKWGFLSDENNVIIHHGFTFPSLSVLHNILSRLSIYSLDNQALVFENEKLYLRRYFQFEYELQKNIKKRLNVSSQYEQSAIKQCIETLFSQKTSKSLFNNEIDWQKIAVANSVNKNFSIIAGGPGTGKTYTVTKLLAAIIMLAQNRNNSDHPDSCKNIKIALVAPTGKAAQRLSESIANAIKGFEGIIDANILRAIPTQAQTIHRLLGVIPNSPNFKHDQNNTLMIDVLLIDEVSMVDLALMTRTFRALKLTTKIILLGDANQLPSVAIGSVLGDIAPQPHVGFSHVNLQFLSRVTGIDVKRIEQSFKQSCVNKHAKEYESNCDYLTTLLKSRRFDGKGGIGLLAEAVISGDSKASWQLLLNSTNEKLEPSQLNLAPSDLALWLKPLVEQYYQPLFSCLNITQAFELLLKFRILCVTRGGRLGVESLNDLVKLYLNKTDEKFYHAQPIMISENDYRLGLYNGDVGFLWKNQNGHLMAYFETNAVEKAPVDKKGKKVSDINQPDFKVILPSRLPKFETVYAMTIHKTQGSEFDHVVMILPQQTENKLLSRELLYTGITRAKTEVTISAKPDIWHLSVENRIKRYSNLNLFD